MMAEYCWYTINPYASSVGQTYDEKKDQDLLMLCKDIPDLMFVVFNLSNDGVVLCLRVPAEYRDKINSIESFGSTLSENYFVTQIQSFVNLKLAKKSVYPLTTGDTESDIFSYLADTPHGVFGIKINHCSSKHILRQYKTLLQKKDDNDICTDPYEKLAKQKSECTVFFQSEIFFGVTNIKNVDEFKSSIPHTAQHEPNYLKQKNRVSLDGKNVDRATNALKKALSSKCKGMNMILSDQDILPFVRFPQNRNLGLDSAKSPTMSSDSLDEKLFSEIAKVGEGEQ